MGFALERASTTRRRRRRWATVSIAFVVAAGAGDLPRPTVAAVAASAGGPRAPRLGATTIISGSEPAVAFVRVESPATVDVHEDFRSARGPSPSISITGGGRFAGFVLVKETSRDTSENFLIAGRFSDCASRGCASEKKPMNYVSPSNIAGSPSGFVDLDPGRYRLYLIADGTPVRIVLRLDGLEGRSSISPTTPAAVDLRAPSVHVSHNDGPAVWAAGSTYEGGAEGLIVVNMFVESRNLDRVGLGGCVYAYPTAPPEEAAYGPHCTALAQALGGGFAFTYRPPEGPRRESVYLTARLGYGEGSLPFQNLDGRYGVGVWYASNAPIDDSGAMAFLLRY